MCILMKLVINYSHDAGDIFKVIGHRSKSRTTFAKTRTFQAMAFDVEDHLVVIERRDLWIVTHDQDIPVRSFSIKNTGYVYV